MEGFSPQTAEKTTPATSRGGVFSAVPDLIKKKGIETVTLAVLGLLGLGFWASWDILKSSAKDFIVQATVEELDKENNRFLIPIKKTVERLRSSELGALNVGNFTLTPSSPSYSLPLYFPQDKEGQLSILLSGDLVPNRSYVVLVLPNGEKLKIETAERTFDLAKYLKIGAKPDAEVMDSLIYKPDSLRALRTLTFQLAGRDTDLKLASASAQPEIAISVHYVALITPPISIPKRQ
jgi:hypothetical protein